MQLRALLAEAGMTGAPIAGAGDPEVATIEIDSRRVVAGSLFGCVPGAVTDGHRHAGAAVAAGAVALVVERPVEAQVPQVVVPSTRAALGPLAAALWGAPSAAMAVVGVTGTNGKTTTVGLLAAIFAAHGWTTATIGTLTQVRTTPEAPDLQRRLAELRAAGTRAVAMEVSSHALDQHRVDATHFAAGVLTNVTQDHLDYHGSMQAYFEAKARLFEPGRAALAVVNRDDAWGQRLLERLRGGPTPTVSFGLGDADGLNLSPGGSRFTWRGVPVALPLAGRFNVANALAAATTAADLGIATDTIAAGLAAAPAVPGRFERFDAGQPFTVVVDYAHTPDALAAVLRAAREVATGRTIVVFGAGGDRDRAKRPLMGAAAASGADLAVVTSDNPRSEDPAAIIAEVLAGTGGAASIETVPDRRAAIARALDVARPGDVVVVAGKGHEQGQDHGGRIDPFDDATEVRSALAALGWDAS
ncbi:MAG TPA: UDP-N-acetylmuramoyl-L-alanyl-D-glutamate--2,6-diaminopimelate ligase [Acidimicrobiales bacterium]|nr:UDP-N-acetylmuramoyl-L-alanyl-D-glutamate--2,6-diaminopimelate ligase [Acidimicrobiales bacterium]